MEKKILDIVEKNFDEQINTFTELLKFNSEGAEKVEKDGEIYPFGQGVQDAFEYTLKKAEDMGFAPKNIDNYGGHIDFGKGDETLGIIGHLDVVPAGEGWDFAPYSGEVADGYVYGRGTTDDKGPVVACLYAMKALKEAGFEPARKIRLILGLDEETNWFGLDHYLEKVEKPTFGFSPDGEFPVINGEKGIIDFDIAGKAEKKGTGLYLSKLQGGSASNMVPESARAVIANGDNDDLKKKAADFAEKTEYKLKAKGIGTSLEITAEGKSAHGASPQKGINAISILMQFLGQLEFEDDNVNKFVEFYNKYIGFDVNGNNIGAGFKDENGILTFNVGLIKKEDELLEITVNVRLPLSKDDNDFYEAITPAVDKYGFGIVKGIYKEPIFMDVDTPMVKTMMQAYSEYSGDKESTPLVIGGGTYSRAFDNMLAYGAAFPGDPDLMHQRNEKISVENFKKMTKIYAAAIYRLAGEDFCFEGKDGETCEKPSCK